MHRRPTRDEARRVLELAPSASPEDLKRAYRRLAREHHPDRGGDPATFHQVRAAYERLGGAGPLEPAFRPGRPSRPDRAGGEPPTDLGSIDWTVATLRHGQPLDRDGVAVWFVDDADPQPLSALSRSPGSRLNRIAGSLAADLTSQLTIAATVDDRGRRVAAVELRGAPRRARRALDHADLDGAWTRRRASSSTSLRATLPLADDPRITAVRIVDRLDILLDGLTWPLDAWRRDGPTA